MLDTEEGRSLPAFNSQEFFMAVAEGHASVADIPEKRVEKALMQAEPEPEPDGRALMEVVTLEGEGGRKKKHRPRKNED